MEGRGRGRGALEGEGAEWGASRVVATAVTSGWQGRPSPQMRKEEMCVGGGGVQALQVEEGG